MNTFSSAFRGLALPLLGLAIALGCASEPVENPYGPSELTAVDNPYVTTPGTAVTPPGGNGSGPGPVVTPPGNPPGNPLGNPPGNPPANPLGNPPPTPKSPVIDDVVFDPAIGYRGERVTLTVKAHDPDGRVKSASVDATSLGVGVTALALRGGKLVAQLAITAEAPLGVHRLKLTVTDNDGRTTEAVAPALSVENRPPTIGAIKGATTVVRGDAFSLSVAASDADGTIAEVAVNLAAVGGAGYVPLEAVEAGTWRGTFVLPLDAPVGPLRLAVRVKDNDGASRTGQYRLAVKAGANVFASNPFGSAAPAPEESAEGWTVPEPAKAPAAPAIAVPRGFAQFYRARISFVHPKSWEFVASEGSSELGKASWDATLTESVWVKVVVWAYEMGDLEKFAKARREEASRFANNYRDAVAVNFANNLDLMQGFGGVDNFVTSIEIQGSLTRVLSLYTFTLNGRTFHIEFFRLASSQHDEAFETLKGSFRVVK